MRCSSRRSSAGLETLSDAASQLSDSLKQRPPEVSWRSITDFRNRLAHGYLDVKPERIWDVIVVHLPLLLAVVEAELDRLRDTGEQLP